MRILYAQKLKCPTISIIEKWLENMLGLAAMANLTALVREKTFSSFITDWKSLIDFLQEIYLMIKIS